MSIDPWRTGQVHAGSSLNGIVTQHGDQLLTMKVESTTGEGECPCSR